MLHDIMSRFFSGVCEMQQLAYRNKWSILGQEVIIGLDGGD